MTPIFAHAGHWITSLIYAAPVVLLVALLGLDHLRNRRRDRDGSGEASVTSTPAGEAASTPDRPDTPAT